MFDVSGISTGFPIRTSRSRKHPVHRRYKSRTSESVRWGSTTNGNWCVIKLISTRPKSFTPNLNRGSKTCRVAVCGSWKDQEKAPKFRKLVVARNGHYMLWSKVSWVAMKHFLYNTSMVVTTSHIRVILAIILIPFPGEWIPFLGITQFMWLVF